MQIVSFPKETICMKCQCLFSGKNIITLLFAEFRLSSAVVLLGSLRIITLVMLNKLRCPTHCQISANQITGSRLLIQIHILNDKQCRSRSVGFSRSQLIWIYTVCKDRTYLGSAGLGLRWSTLERLYDKKSP